MERKALEFIQYVLVLAMVLLFCAFLTVCALGMMDPKLFRHWAPFYVDAPIGPPNEQMED